MGPMMAPASCPPVRPPELVGPAVVTVVLVVAVRVTVVTVRTVGISMETTVTPNESPRSRVSFCVMTDVVPAGVKVRALAPRLCRVAVVAFAPTGATA